MRNVSLALLVLPLAGTAYASFDLMILPDASGSRYTRFDPINRVALGHINVEGGSRVTAVASNPNGIYQ